MEAPQEGSTIGALTYTDLKDLTVFDEKPTPDAWDILRLPFSIKLARFSAELVADAYDINISPWVQAGFTDCTFVIEDRVVVLDRDSDSKLAAIEAEWKRRRARAMMRGIRPIGDLVRTVRQLFVTDMAKSIVMTRLMPDGRILIAISFIGTTEKFFDWFSNFKLRDASGMHYGFQELARQFHTKAESVNLPFIAESLGKETFSLLDALRDAVLNKEQYLFWISGHSQGGAVAQIYTQILLQEGIEPEQIYAYTFAAPTVAYAHTTAGYMAYPIYHIINHDDLVPRIGAQVRFGVDCVFFPDDAFRKSYYNMGELPYSTFSTMLLKTNRIQSTNDALCFGMSMMRIVMDYQHDAEIQAFLSCVIPMFSIMKRVGVNIEDAAKYFYEKLTDHYTALQGEKLDDSEMMAFIEAIRWMIDSFGVTDTAKALQASMIEPHRIRPDQKDEMYVSPYIAIVRKHGNDLLNGIWKNGQDLICVDSRGNVLLPYRLGQSGYFVK